MPIAKLGASGPHLLLDEDFPDPFVARFGSETLAYATGVKGMNVQAIRSKGFTGWSAPAEMLSAANLPAWVDRNLPQVWAPEVYRIANRYLLYFNARHATLTRRPRSSWASCEEVSRFWRTTCSSPPGSSATR